MTKFKVGDKVRILHTGYTECGLDVGTVHSVTAINGGLARLDAALKDGERADLCFFDFELELDDERALTVGKTYTSKNGHEWLCVAVYGEYAYMRNADTPQSAAYCFKTDGENLCQGGGDWDIKFEPVREKLVVRGGLVTGYLENATVHPEYSDHKFTMTIDMVDGKPDWSSAKLTGA